MCRIEFISEGLKVVLIVRFFLVFAVHDKKVKFVYRSLRDDSNTLSDVSRDAKLDAKEPPSHGYLHRLRFLKKLFLHNSFAAKKYVLRKDNARRKKALC